MPTTTDLIGLAIDKNPIDFADAFDAIMKQKAVERLDDYKVDLAKTLYGEPEVDQDDQSDEFDFDTDETDDIDVSDFDDIDLDDIDIEDLANGDD